jgi:putative nucleotidyltransferase with HDIG domain
VAQHDPKTRAEALRRMAIARHQRSEGREARRLCQESHRVAVAAGEALLAATALNSLAAFDLADGNYDAARPTLLRALASSGIDDALRGRIRQNLGIIANIRGQLEEAEEQYVHALAAFTACGDERGSAMALNSLGHLSADRKQWGMAEARLRQSLDLTMRIGDVHMRGLALLSISEVRTALGQLDVAARDANEALRIFDQIGVVRHKADAYRAIGGVYRASRDLTQAESALRTALDLARTAGGVLEEAEAARALALVHRELGRNQDALRHLNLSQRLFRRLDARTDLVDVTARLQDLESTFLAVVRDWGQSIESADSYTHGHCERVATYAVAVARGLALDQEEQTTIRLGAYLHDLGKINTPLEILNKPGRLNDEELAIMQRHPVEGLDLLADVDFPWDIKPMIRWHHEKYCGGGYPDGIDGDAIPLNAQIICIADVFDALTTTRSYRPAMSRDRAVEIMESNRDWWREDVYAAFRQELDTLMPDDAASPSLENAGL